MRHTRVEKVGTFRNISPVPPQSHLITSSLPAPLSEAGGQSPDHHHDGAGAGGGRRAGSQDSAQSSSQTFVQVPDSALTGHQSDWRTPTVTLTCPTREGAHAHTCQVGGAFMFSLCFCHSEVLLTLCLPHQAHQVPHRLTGSRRRRRPAALEAGGLRG